MADYTKITIKARAKINLGLDIIGKRSDGHHLLRMIMQSVGLHDTLSFEVTKEPRIHLTSDVETVPNDERNLVYKAIRLIRDRYGIEEGVLAHITKKIPVAAGLAGGSADAAAAVEAMDRLFTLKLSGRDKACIGLELGADVPFCLMGGTALAEGIGEELTVLPPLPECFILLVKPDCGISTKDAYAAFDRVERAEHPDIDGIAGALKERDIEAVCRRLGNVLEPVSKAAHPEIEDIRQMMLATGASGAMMSGSGPTVFGIFRDKDRAAKALDVFKQGIYGRAAFLTGPAGSGLFI